MTEILLTEKCGTLGRRIIYTRNEENNKLLRINVSKTYATSILRRIQDLFREVFLPHGYPDTVSEDYLEYQVWDTVQAFCSTVTGTFTTQAILKGIGVGDETATPLAAAITWIFKDGTGMIGRIVFAWLKGNLLDSDCKKWRLFADVLNDTAMFFELLIPYFRNFSLQILCVTTLMKSIVGVAGGATRAAIIQHQAIQGNTADISAKDGSQETCVNLLASFVGIFILAYVTDQRYHYLIFAVFTLIHILANYFAVCSLVIPYLNKSRLNAVLKTYLRFDTVPNPLSVNKNESVIIGFGENVKDICGFDIKIANSLKSITSSLTPSNLDTLVNPFKNSKYLLIPNIKKMVIYIALETGESSEDVIMAYFHAVLFGIVLCYYNNISVNVYSKRQLKHVTPIVRIYASLKSFPKNTGVPQELITLNALKTFNEVVNQEITMFFTALKINNWDTSRHALEMGQWRAKWKSSEINSFNEYVEENQFHDKNN